MGYKSNLSYLLLMLLVVSVDTQSSPLLDPTKPGVYPLKTTENSNKRTIHRSQLLTAIFYKLGKRRAIIDGQLYAVGDYVGNKKITSIETNHVTLQSKSGQKKLRLLTNFKKTSTTKK